ncbi:ABC transporter ATP-binding protein [Serinicoccus kebangsaanensis]|uniref:ABC transporter ATP-binding protein n=1 Tax=Serinicoccus kebangsaanensis TaxID=2602069 RepID=UPI00124EAD3B|nr:ATP-binding cassette domain-containing protein [Serinicoccus kebangsaanensis]
MIQIENLAKRYGAFTAVDDITFTARPGRVTGFLGPNGAGKSTAMRMMCGLTPATSGTAHILGRPYRSLPNPTTHVGVMLDAGAQHAGRTGREVLGLAAILVGAGRGQVDSVLDRIGLTSREAERRVGNYSLGMRQRLGLGAALIGDPSVLILDEPANGLDPGGIHWMRELLRSYAQEGGTVLLSSHLLSEVEQVADDLVLIGRGRIVAQGTKEELLSSAGVVVDATDREALHAALHRAGFSPVARPRGGFAAQAGTAQIGELALAEGLVITNLSSSGGGLEEMFLTLTADDAREVAA